MSWASIADNQCISQNNLQDAVTNGIFTAISSIPASQQQITKAVAASEIVIPSPTYPPYFNKTDDQLLVKSDIYTLGPITLTPQYGMYFTNIVCTGFPSSIPYPIATFPYATYYVGVLPAQTMSVYLNGTRTTTPVNLSVYINGVRISCQDITTNGAQVKNIIIPAIYAASTVSIAIYSGYCGGPPPPDLNGRCFSAVAVNRGSGQHMVAANANIYQSSGFVPGYIYYSINYGVTWVQTTTSGYWFDISSSDDGQYVIAVENGGKAYLSTNYGAAFTQISSLGTDSFTSASLSNDGQYQVITTASTTISRVYFSSNYGASWTTVKSATSYEYYYTSSMDSSGSNILIGGGQVRTEEANGLNPFIFKSTNYGTSWTLITLGFTFGTLLNIGMYANGTSAIAATSGGYPGDGSLWLSNNNGTTFSQINGSSSRQAWYRVALPNQSPTAAYAVTSLGNSGTAYIQKVTNLFSGPTVSNLTSSGNRNWHSIACSDSGTYILAGAGNGLWLSSDGGTSFTQI